MMQKKRLLFFLPVLFVLVCTGVIGVVRATTPVHAAAPAITGLHVSGNQILNGSNQVIRPLGVDRAGSEYMCDSSGGIAVFDGPSDDASVAAMASWDINAVRVPLNEDCWLGINGYPAASYSATQYQQAIVNYVNLLNAHNLIAIVDLHWGAPGSQQSNSQLPMADANHAPAFWTSVANTFKSNSSVIFDLYNEPYVQNWSCWLNGSSAASSSPCSDVNFAVAGMQTLVNTVRATGATNILMLGGLAYSNDLSQWLQNKPNDPLNNLAASFHLYNFNACSNTSCWNSQVAPVAAQVPVVTGELGENDCAATFINSAMSWLDQHGIGYLGWAWNTYDCKSFPSLITNYNGTPTAFGQGLRDHLIALAGGGGTNPTPVPTQPPVSTPTPTPVSTPPPTGSTCAVNYAVSNQWQGGFTGAITVKNTGSATITNWTLTFSFADGQQVTQGWNGTFTQQGANVSVANVSYNATIAPGSTVNPGFNASWSGTNANPTAFSLNGTACSVS